MDQLQREIEALTARRDRVRQEADALKVSLDEAKRKYDDATSVLHDIDIELRAYMRAAALRPADDQIVTAQDGQTTFVQVEPATKRHRGRQPGSISKRWRCALSDLVAAGNQPVDQQQFYLLTRARLGLAETSVRDRARKYVLEGILSEADGKLSVSAEAIAKFDLSEPDSYPRANGEAENTTAPH